MNGGEWVRLPNGHLRWFTDQELAEMDAADWEESKPIVYFSLSLFVIFLFSLGAFLLYGAYDLIKDHRDIVSMIIFGTLGISAIGWGIHILKKTSPDILPTFFVTIIVVAFALWGAYSCYRESREEDEKLLQEQKEKGEHVYEPIPAEFYQY